MKKYHSLEAETNSKNACRDMYRKKYNENWQENGCSKCHKGMTKNIYDFQLENGLQPTCQTCDKKDRLLDLDFNL